MSKVSFEKQVVETPVAGVTIDTTTTHVASEEKAPESAPVSPSNALAPRQDSPHAIFDDNNIGFEDIKLPRINVVQKVGELSNTFREGEVVLDQTHVIYAPARPLPGQAAPKEPAPLNVVILGFKRTTFVEKVEGGGMGLHCRTREDVVRVGGTLDYKEWAESVKASKENPNLKPMRRFDYMTTAMVLVEKPATFEDKNNTIFPYPCNGKHFVLAFLTMKASAYNHGAKDIFTFKKTRSFSNPNVSYSDTYFELKSFLKKFPTGTFSWVPDFRPAALVEKEVIALVNTIKGIPAPEA